MRPLPALLLGALLSACYAPKISVQRSYHPSDADVTVTRLVHGSVILDFRGKRVLVDPWYSPDPPVGPGAEIGLAVNNLPEMHGILITHDHGDHLDRDTLKAYPAKGVRVVVPKEIGPKLAKLGYTDVVEIGDGGRTEVAGIAVHAVPASHSVPENGYVLEAHGVTVYVAGDTRFEPRIFWSIAERFPKIDVALLPIGGIRWFGMQVDMNPDEAARAFGILKPERVIPYHYELIGPVPIVLGRAEATTEFVQAIELRFPGIGNAVVPLTPGESWHYYK